MKEESAHKLIQQYIDGWRQNDLQKIISCLTDDCTVIESHGPTYQGIEDIKKWFDFWLEAKGLVTKWDLNAFYYLSNQKTAFCQWDFVCVSNNKEHLLPGASLIKYSSHKISFIHEYRMTKPIYLWQKDELKSE